MGTHQTNRCWFIRESPPTRSTEQVSEFQCQKTMRPLTSVGEPAGRDQICQVQIRSTSCPLFSSSGPNIQHGASDPCPTESSSCFLLGLVRAQSYQPSPSSDRTKGFFPTMVAVCLLIMASCWNHPVRLSERWCASEFLIYVSLSNLMV